MAKSGPIILVDDDRDDEQFLREALSELGISNHVEYFDDPRNAFSYLKSTRESPFLILSDVNMPLLNGIEFKRKIDNDQELRRKSIPFVFFSTAAEKQAIDTAYHEMTVQGFFTKPSNFLDLVHTIKVILDYREICNHPYN